MNLPCKSFGTGLSGSGFDPLGWGLFPTYLRMYSVRLCSEEDAVGPVGLVLPRGRAVVIDRGQALASSRDRVGEQPEGVGYGVTTAMAELHQPGKAQGVLVTGPRAVEMPIVMHDLFVDQPEQPGLSLIQFLDDAGLNPDPFLDRPHLRPRASDRQ